MRKAAVKPVRDLDRYDDDEAPSQPLQPRRPTSPAKLQRSSDAPQARRAQLASPAESRPALSRFELLEEGESKLLIDSVQFQLDGLFTKAATTQLRRRSAWKLLEICQVCHFMLILTCR